MAKNSVYAKLSAARADMSFEKRETKLSYLSLNADDVLQMVGDALVKHGVLFVPSMINVDITWYEKNAKPVQHALAKFEILFFDIETGDELKLMTHGSAEDYSDKALGKAQSYAIKHLFSRMFLKGEDDSINDEEDMSDAPPSELDKATWTRNDSATETLTRLRNKSAVHWQGDDGKELNYSHVYNRIAIIIGSEQRPTAFPAFCDMMRDECKLSAEAVWAGVESYKGESES